MELSVKTKRLRIDGMTCVSCQNKIERKLLNTAGVEKAEVSYSAGTAVVTYDMDIISFKDITAVIERLDYSVSTGNEQREHGIGRVIGFLVIIVALYVLLQQFGILNLLVPSRLADAKMGYGMLFIIGLITSVHCIAMCGGINLSQCIPKGKEAPDNESRLSTFIPASLYNLGRIISYTVIGFILGFGGLLFGGGGDAGLPVMAQGILKLIAGVFMVVMGINMLGIFPWLRRLNPRMPKIFAGKVNSGRAKSNSPLIVGLLNGLMPCGPLQSMQIVALASGNPLAGALSMFLFSLGTVPLMLGLGSIVSALGKKFTQKVMSVGAVLVVVLGLAMLSQGGSLSGFLTPDLLLTVILALCAVGIVINIPFSNPSYKTVCTVAVLGVAILAYDTLALDAWNLWGNFSNPIAFADSGVTGGNTQSADGKQVINSTLSSGRYPNITVQAGTPVMWVIDAPKGSINGCNNRINIKEYGITNYSFKTGENIIEFNPVKTGKFQYSCWMGMIRGTITVVESSDAAAAPTVTKYDGSQDSDSPFDYNTFDEPIPANYTIPTNEVAIAEIVSENGYDYQQVTVNLTDKGFSPAVMVVQAGLDAEWIIINNSFNVENSVLLVPSYHTQVPLEPLENPLYLYPTESFDFSNGDNSFYGYVKVVENINEIDEQAIKDEVGKFETLIYPPDTFDGDSGSGGCCGGDDDE